MITADVLTELVSILPKEQIHVVELQQHSLGNDGHITVFPRTESEIAQILSYANDNGKKISVEGGGTKRGFGGLMKQADILLSLSQYKGIVEHTVGDMTLTVKSGTTFKEIQDYLAKHNQKVSLDPSWPEFSTIGGIIASNESGPKRLGYGSARDVVIGLRLVYPNGEVIRTGGKVVKNVAGYDMSKLFIGSMGTLGVVSEVTVKLRPIAKSEKLILVSFLEKNFNDIRNFSTMLLDSMMEPVSLDILNPSLSKKLTGEAAYTLAISYEDVENAVKYQQDFTKRKQPPETKLKILEQEEAEMFWDQFYQIGPNGASLKSSQNMASLKIGVVSLDVLQIMKEFQLLQDAHHVLIEANGGIGHGLCQINIKGEDNDILSAIQHIKTVVADLKGYVIVKHLPFHLREQVEVWGVKPSYFFLLEGIKAKIDPNRVLNHKRFIGGI